MPYGLIMTLVTDPEPTEKTDVNIISLSTAAATILDMFTPLHCYPSPNVQC